MPISRKKVLRDLGRAVRARRAERGLTLQALSEEAGVSPRFLASLEGGQGNISVVRLCEVAAALGTTAASLLEGVGDRRGSLVALVGLRGAGKSTIGPKLALRLALPFLELDQLVEQSAGESLSELFELHGEAYYRRLERETLRSLVSQGTSAILATGGSIVNDVETYELLCRSATTVWLKARPEDHMHRVVAQGDERPLKNRSDAMTELRTLLKTRATSYAQADHVVDTSVLGIEGSVDVLVATLWPALSRG